MQYYKWSTDITKNNSVRPFLLMKLNIKAIPLFHKQMLGLTHTFWTDSTSNGMVCQHIAKAFPVWSDNLS